MEDSYTLNLFMVTHLHQVQAINRQLSEEFTQQPLGGRSKFSDTHQQAETGLGLGWELGNQNPAKRLLLCPSLVSSPQRNRSIKFMDFACTISIASMLLSNSLLPLMLLKMKPNRQTRLFPSSVSFDNNSLQGIYSPVQHPLV